MVYGSTNGDMYGNTLEFGICVDTGTPKAEGNVKNRISYIVHGRMKLHTKA